MKTCLLTLCCCIATLAISTLSASADDWTPPSGYRSLFNGKDFTGWHAMPTFDVSKLAAMSEEERKATLDKWNADIPAHWKVENGVIINDGKGAYLTTDESFRDFELVLDVKMFPKGDSGVYLKSNPQVQLWDTTEAGGSWKHGADKGSGGLWNNSKGAPGKDPLVHADKPLGEWNSLKVQQIGARTSVWLNGQLVVDNAIMENFFNRAAPLPVAGEIQLQTHGSEVQWRHIALRDIPADEAAAILKKKSGDGFVAIFNGKDLTGWKGATDSYEVVDGVIRGKSGKGGTMFTEKEYADFVVRLEFKLPPAGNNGLAIRYPGEGNAHLDGFTEIQILDSEHEKYKTIDPRQAHGSVYGIIPAARGYLRPVGEWNYQEVTVKGPHVVVELNGSKILDGDVSTVKEVMGNKDYPGRTRTSGFFGFAGHSDPVEFRNVEIKELAK